MIYQKGKKIDATGENQREKEFGPVGGRTRPTAHAEGLASARGTSWATQDADLWGGANADLIYMLLYVSSFVIKEK